MVSKAGTKTTKQEKEIDIPDDDSLNITVLVPPSIEGNILSANVVSTGSNNIRRASFALFDNDYQKLDIKSLVSVNRPSDTSYNNEIDALTWGYDPLSKNANTFWEIDVTNLPSGEYFMMFYSTDGESVVNSDFYSVSIQIEDQEHPEILELRVNPVQPYLYQQFSISVIVNRPAASIKVDLDGYLPVGMSASSNLLGWEYTFESGLSDLEEKKFQVYINGESEASYIGHITATIDPEAPVISNFVINPEAPYVGEEITFNISLDRPLEQLELVLEDTNTVIEMSSSGDGLNWFGNLPQGLSHNIEQLVSIFGNKKQFEKHRIKANSHYWYLNDSVDENNDDAVFVGTGEVVTKYWLLTNNGDFDWENFYLEQCNDSSGNDCEVVLRDISVMKNSKTSEDDITFEFTMPKTQGVFKKWFRLYTANGGLVTMKNGTPHFWVELNVKNNLEELCEELEQLCKDNIQDKFDGAFKECKASNDDATQLQSKIYSKGKIKFTVQNNSEYNWSLAPSFKASVNIGSSHQSVKQLAIALNESEHYLPTYTLFNNSEKNDLDFYCKADAAMVVLANDFSDAVKSSNQKKIAQLQSLHDSEEEIIKGVNKTQALFSNRLRIGLGDAVMDDLQQIESIMKARATLSYAISRSFNDFFIDDFKDIAALQSKIDELQDKLGEIDKFIKFLDYDFENIPAFNELVNIADADPEGLWMANTKKIEEILQRDSIKELFAKAIGIETHYTELLDSKEFGYLLGYYGGQTMFELVQLYKLKKLPKKITKGVAKKAVKSIFKAAKIVDRLVKGVKTQSILLNSDSSLAKLKAMKTILEAIGSQQSSSDAFNKVAVKNGDFSADLLANECTVFEDKWPTGSEYRKLGACNVYDSGNKFGRKWSFKYSLINSNTYKPSRHISGDKSKLNQKQFVGTDYQHKNEKCELHHIIPLTVNAYQSDDYRYFENDQSNLIYLPNSANKKNQCSNNDNAAIHNGGHKIYNNVVKLLLKARYQNDNHIKPVDYVVLRNMLRTILKSGRGLFPMYRKNKDDLPSEGGKEPKVKSTSKKMKYKNMGRNIVSFLEKYNKLADSLPKTK
uniref:Uncharacterized protein n=1 Tax=Colwellia sp. C1 TaxID=1737566 RepID=A0A0P0LXU3_9GAMM|nr:hypothetical protein [Colwellia sp. C1]